VIPNTIDYLRRNAIALTALGCSLLALAGGTYAAVSLPAGSVGTRQLRNGSVTPSKLDRRLLGGSIRAWANVNTSYQLIGGSPGARVINHPPQNGGVLIGWGRRFPRGCGIAATPGLAPAPARPSLIADLDAFGRVTVDNEAGGAPYGGFTVAVIC